MPKEVRYLLFSHDEVLRALLEDADRATPGRRARPADFHLRLSAASGAVVATVTARRQDPAAQDVTGTGLLAVLLRLCKRHRIPMPLKGLKRLEVAEGGLALTITLDTGPLQGPEAALSAEAAG